MFKAMPTFMASSCLFDRIVGPMAATDNGRRTAAQKAVVVRQMQPGQPLVGKGVVGRSQARRIVEGADVQMDLARPALAFVGDGRAAARAEAAPHAGRGGEIGELALDAHLGRLEAGIGRDRSAGVAAAALAMTVAGPFGRVLGGEAKGAAQASSLEHAASIAARARSVAGSATGP